MLPDMVELWYSFPIDVYEAEEYVLRNLGLPLRGENA